jgi:hypothetical protein
MKTIKFRVYNHQTKVMFKHFPGARIDLGLSYFERNIKVSEPMQFTGLKDKNGKEIYEGDIIDHFAFYSTVIFEDGMFTTKNSANTQFCNCKQPLAYHDCSFMEVVGNIHENKDLL